MSKTNFTIQSIFSTASRERCITNIKKFQMPPMKKSFKIPSASAAVLVPLCSVNNVPSLLYTVRSMQLKSHSGQISFPGGKTDKDEKPIDTALRETQEEIGLSPERIDIWGCLPPLPGRDYKIMITPVIGHITDLKEGDLQINEKEVFDVFTVPLESLCDPANQFHTQFKNGFILPAFVCKNYKIWGITAYMTHIFLTCLFSKDIYKSEWTKKKIDLKEVRNENA